MVFDVAIRERNRAASVVIVSGGISHPSVNHIYDKKSVVNGIGAFVYENEGRGRAGIVNGGKFVGIIELGHGGAVVIPTIHPLVHGNRTNERITGAIDINRVGVRGADIDWQRF